MRAEALAFAFALALISALAGCRGGDDAPAATVDAGRDAGPECFFYIPHCLCGEPVCTDAGIWKCPACDQ